MIVATAGHVDHGKTALVRALTGVDADRLPEEKKRGMTIDLGFAYRGGIGFVDVPGHERFVHNMLAGVCGIDLALLVVAADDGPMPQTREHLAILRLLRVPRIAAAVTKVDRVARSRVTEVASRVHELVGGTSPFQVSSVSGEGLLALSNFLEECASKTAARAARGNFRLSVDRVFTLRGAGLVVTGTALSGEIAAGAQVRALLCGGAARVRGLHAHNAPAQRARAGQRIALNLAGLNGKTPIARGEWIVAGAAPEPVRRFDARLECLDAPLAHGARVHLHLGATHAMARLFHLGASFVQILCEEPVGCVFGDRFIVRDASARRTLGGGTVIDIFAPARGRARPERLAWLRAMALEEDEAALSALAESSARGVDLARFAANRNLPAASGWRFSMRRWRALRDGAVSAIASWHAQHPDASTMPEKLIAPGIEAGARERLLEELVEEGRILRHGGGVRFAAHAPRLGADDAAAWKRIRGALERAGTRPPTIAEIAQALTMEPAQVEALLGRLARQGELVRISRNRYFLPATVERFKGMILDMRNVTAAEFRDRTGIGRGLAIEVLEFFDRTRLTQRLGDVHVLRKAAYDKQVHPA